LFDLFFFVFNKISFWLQGCQLNFCSYF